MEVASPGELALARAACGAAHPHRPGLPRQDHRRTARGPRPRHRRERGQRAGSWPASTPSRELRAPPAPPLGVRVNPQIGAGSIGALSTATATSKFGVALRDEGARAWLVRVPGPAVADPAARTPGRRACRAGADGRGRARTTCELAEEINAAAGRQQVDTLDIGGGLPASTSPPTRRPRTRRTRRAARRDRAGPLRRAVRHRHRVRPVTARQARHAARPRRVREGGGGRPIAVTHAGVQVATRTVYAPASWPLRIAAYDAKGLPKTGPAVAQDVAGPACFCAVTCSPRTTRCRSWRRATTPPRSTPARTTSRAALLVQLAGQAGRLRLRGGRRRRGCGSRPRASRRRSRRSSPSPAVTCGGACATSEIAQPPRIRDVRHGHDVPLPGTHLGEAPVTTSSTPTSTTPPPSGDGTLHRAIGPKLLILSRDRATSSAPGSTRPPGRSRGRSAARCGCRS